MQCDSEYEEFSESGPHQSNIKDVVGTGQASMTVQQILCKLLAVI